MSKVYGIHQPWTEHEKNRVREVFPSGDLRALAAELDRSVRDIYNCAYRIGAVRNKLPRSWAWPQWQVDILLANFGVSPVAEIALKVGRTPWAVKRKAQNMGLGLKSMPQPSRTSPLLTQSTGISRPLVATPKNVRSVLSHADT